MAKSLQGVVAPNVVHTLSIKTWFYDAIIFIDEVFLFESTLHLIIIWWLWYSLIDLQTNIKLSKNQGTVKKLISSVHFTTSLQVFYHLAIGATKLWMEFF